MKKPRMSEPHADGSRVAIPTKRHAKKCAAAILVTFGKPKITKGKHARHARHQVRLCLEALHKFLKTMPKR
jgi:hypothetical protein